jgi:hypothetical protein
MGNKYKKFRHNDVTEVDEEDMAPHLPKDHKAERKRKASEEFWSDNVWKTHPDDDIYGSVCHPPNQKPERA